MTDPVPSLRAKFSQQNRYANFGAVLRSIRIKGFRGIDDFTLLVDSPVTAISGLNGSGKSTIGQISACAYRKPTESVGYKRYYVRDFFPVSVVDPTPFTAGASVEYTYESNYPGSPQTVTVSRTTKEWSGYKRQPERYVYYVGFTLYLPKVERKDLSVSRGAAIQLNDQRVLSEATRVEVGKILNQPYNTMHFQGYSHKQRQAELGVVERWGSTYSENHMGFGEGRVLYMVDLFETAPEQSLFILEEPETSLHEDAQRRLGKYLLDVTKRRHHQIILSTHSSAVLDALPSESRKLLYRDAKGLECFSGLSSTRAWSILAGGVPVLSVCVEDEFAKIVLTEIIRCVDSNLIPSCNIIPVGDKGAVQNAVKLLIRAGHSAIGIRDGDVGEAPDQKLWSLPGTHPPEREVFTNADVITVLRDTYGLDVPAFFTIYADLDIHHVPGLLAGMAHVPVDALNHTAVFCYSKSLDKSKCISLVETIKLHV